MLKFKELKYLNLVIFIIIILIAMGAFFELGESLGKALVK